MRRYLLSLVILIGALGILTSANAQFMPPELVAIEYNVATPIDDFVSGADVDERTALISPDGSQVSWLDTVNGDLCLWSRRGSLLCTALPGGIFLHNFAPNGLYIRLMPHWSFTLDEPDIWI